MDNFKVLIKIYPFCFVPEYSALIYSSFLHTSHVICVLFTFDTLSQRRPTKPQHACITSNYRVSFLVVRSDHCFYLRLNQLLSKYFGLLANFYTIAVPTINPQRFYLSKIWCKNIATYLQILIFLLK